MQTNRHYRIYTRHAGSHDVTAQTKREAIARVVARLGLGETRCLYCGRTFEAKGDRRYCHSCVNAGYHWLHQVTGRTKDGAQGLR